MPCHLNVAIAFIRPSIHLLNRSLFIFLSHGRIDIHQIITHDMQDLGEGAESAAGDAVHEVGKVEQDTSGRLVAALVRHAVQAQSAAALDELVDEGEGVFVFAVRRQHVIVGGRGRRRGDGVSLGLVVEIEEEG